MSRPWRPAPTGTGLWERLVGHRARCHWRYEHCQHEVDFTQSGTPRVRKPSARLVEARDAAQLDWEHARAACDLLEGCQPPTPGAEIYDRALKVWQDRPAPERAPSPGGGWGCLILLALAGAPPAIQFLCLLS